MATLSGATIASTYATLIKLDANDATLVAASGGNAIQLKTGDNDTTPIYLNTDRVGIGTATPGQTLAVQKDQDAATAISVKNASTGTTADSRISWYSSDQNFNATFYGSGHSGGADKMIFHDSASSDVCFDISGNVGIGTTAPARLLDIENPSSGSDAHIRLGTNDANKDAIIELWTGEDSYGKTAIVAEGLNSNRKANLHFVVDIVADTNSYTLGTDTKLFIDGNNGNVGIGTTSPSRLLDIETTDSAGSTIVSMVSATDGNCQLLLGDTGADTQGKVLYNNNGDYMALTVNGSERLRILSTGLVGIGITDHGDNLTVRGSEVRIIKSIDTAADGTGTFFFEGSADDNEDVNFQVTTSGIVHGTGSFAADLDYAEFFESTDGTAIARGITVVLIDGKVRVAKEGESPFGVVRPFGVSSVVGGEPHKWYKKHLRDDYGVIIREDDGRKKLNPDFVENLDEDDEQIYARRADRDEWQIVGLLGQVQIEKGQPVASSWIKMKEVSDSVDMYYIFPCTQVVNNNEQGESSNEQE